MLRKVPRPKKLMLTPIPVDLQAFLVEMYPVETGITIDRWGLVLAVHPRVHESSGVQEGDTLLNADRHPGCAG